MKHQEILAAKRSEKLYFDTIKTSKKAVKIEKVKGELIDELQRHPKLFYDFFGGDINRVSLITFMHLNSFAPRKGFFIIMNNSMHEIDAVLKCNDSFVFLCTEFTTVNYLKFANYFEITKTAAISLIDFKELKCKRTYEAKIFNNRTTIIADNLDMLPIYDKYIK